MKVGKSKAAKGDATFSVKKKINKNLKDPNKPKRPPSAFFVFMEGFRKDFKENNPDNKLVSVVSKAGGDKWKSLSDAEKTPYVEKAEKLKAEYLKNVKAFDKVELKKDGAKKAETEGEESDKSKSEVNDEEGEEGDDDCSRE